VIVVLALVFAALFGVALVPAISDLLALPAYYALLGLEGSVPWPLLVLRVAVPPVLFVAALLIGRRRPLTARALVFAAALAAAFALGLGIVAWVGAIQPPLPG
jgi:hypothetical protein